MRKRMAVSARACGICSGELCDFGAIAIASEEAQAGQPGPGWAAAGLAETWGAESTVQLQCKHCFHDQCIRGWTIVGKKVRPPCCTRRLNSLSMHVIPVLLLCSWHTLLCKTMPTAISFLLEHCECLLDVGGALCVGHVPGVPGEGGPEEDFCRAALGDPQLDLVAILPVCAVLLLHVSCHAVSSLPFQRPGEATEALRPGPSIGIWHCSS